MFFLYFFVVLPPVSDKDNKVLIVVDSNYVLTLEKELETYKNDLEAEGWNVKFLFTDGKYHFYSEFKKN